MSSQFESWLQRAPTFTGEPTIHSEVLLFGDRLIVGWRSKSKGSLDPLDLIDNEYIRKSFLEGPPSLFERFGVILPFRFSQSGIKAWMDLKPDRIREIIRDYGSVCVCARGRKVIQASDVPPDFEWLLSL